MGRIDSVKEKVKKAAGKSGPLHYVLEKYGSAKRRIRSAKAEREARKARREAFQDIYKNDKWGYLRLEGAPDDFYSGPGSYAEELVDPYVSLVKELVLEKGITSIADLGCGDFNVGSRIAPLVANYTGCDIVPELIERNKRKFGDSGRRFVCLDIADDDLPAADLCLIREVLMHLGNEEILRILPKLRQYKYVLVTESIKRHKEGINNDIKNGGYRGVSLGHPPFNMEGAEVLRLDHPHDKEADVVSTLFCNS